MREDIKAFLSLWGEPTEAELRLWAAALAPIGDSLVEVLAAWLQAYEKKPLPRAVLTFYFSRSVGGKMWEIAERVAVECNITIAELQSSNRCPRVSKPRQRLMSELHEAGFSLPRIGRFLDRDHTTVHHGIKVYAAQAAQDRRE